MLNDWIEANIPAWLGRVGPFGVEWWQWLALLTLIPLAGFLGRVIGLLSRNLLKRLVARTANRFDDEMVAATREPLILLWADAAAWLLLRWIQLPEKVQLAVTNLQQALLVVAIFWAVLRIIRVLQDGLPRTLDLVAHPALRSLIPLGGRIARVFVFAIGVLAVVSVFGYKVTTILAGLGIGGIAVALGAQKSLEHFFGSVSLGVDQPFRIGDWVLVNGVEGEIEAIGLRSTRIRTMERTVVTIPNGILAESQSENFGARERIRLRAVIGLEYGTPAATMRAVRDDIEALLRAHPLTWPDRVVVRFFQFGASSLDIELFCWLRTSQQDEFRAVREELYLGVIAIVERHGAKFAFPTQTLHVAALPPVRS